MNILIAQFAHISPNTKIFDKYLRNAFKGQKKIDLVVLGEYVANKFFKEYRTKSTLKREFEANKKYFLGLAKKYKTTIVAPVIEWEKGRVYKSILVASNSSLGAGNSHLGLHSANLDSADSQNLAKNNSVRSTQTRPLRGAKNQIQASSSASADFLLEAEKRGSPPKSEKRQLLARRGSEVGGAALLRKETNKVDDDGSAESSANSQNLQIYRATRLMSFPHWDERAFFSNTQNVQEPLIFSVGGFKVSAIFGWEAHFDEVMMTLRKKGVDILIIPTASAFGSNARWQRLMQTRAFLNSCIIVRANRIGEFVENGNIWDFYGESFIALPDGNLGDMMGEKEGILISEIEKENLENIKNLWQFR